MRYAVWASVVGSFLAALVFGFVYNQFPIGISLFLVGFGSTPLPDISAAGVYGYLILKNESADEFFGRASKWVLNREIRIIFWLALLLRKSDLLRRLSLVGNYAFIPMIAYFLGWALLSVAGGFPATIFGISIGFLVPIGSYAAIRRRFKQEDRERLTTILLNKISKSADPQT